MTIPPFFSIIIPTYQRRDIVREAVQAASKLSYEGEAEVIVVVDGSTDGTVEELRSVAGDLPIRVIVQQNRGQAHARNRGARDATGELLLFLDDDMIAADDLLQRHAESFSAGVDAVVGDFPVDARSEPGFLTDSIAGARRWERVGNQITSPFDIFSGHLAVRKSAFEAIGGFDENFTRNGTYGNEDIDFGHRLLGDCRVLRDPRAIAWQRHTVPPCDYMRRARMVASADLHFARKHPELADELFTRRGRGRISRKLELASRLPLIPRALASMMVLISDAALKTRFRSMPLLAHLFTAIYLVNYWSAVRKLETHERAAGSR